MPVDVVTGNCPLIIALPYTGSNMPRLIRARLRDPDQAITVPDYYVDRLFAGLNDKAGIIRCNSHRYLSDVNVKTASDPIDGTQGRVGAIPFIDNVGNTIWETPPSKTEVSNWRASYYAPFHAALGAQIAKARSVHGHAVVLTCRGLHTQGPFQQETIDADINLASQLGGSCAVDLFSKLVAIAETSNEHSAARSKSRKVGWITRHYGRPNGRVHALDISIKDSCYLTNDDFPGHYDEKKAETLRDVLRDVVNFAASWRPS